MTSETIFALQFALSLTVFGILTAWFVVPWLDTLPDHKVLAVLIAPHTFRHIGLTFLVASVTAPTMPREFAIAAGYGDLAAGLLAIAALLALLRRWRGAIFATWLFNVVGSLDLVYALQHVGVVRQMGPTWFIPTFLVPLLLISHALIFHRLLSGRYGFVSRSFASE